MLIPGTILNGRYLIERFLAKGGGGAVYEAYDNRNQRPVALKQLIHSDPYFRRAFVREAERLAALHHPAFPEIYEWFEVKDNSFLVMEYIPGQDLRRALQQRGAPFPLKEVLEWAFILLDALDYLHTRDPRSPIIHRDIKPENLKRNETNLIRRSAVILLDFGLSKGAAGNISQWSADVSMVGYTRGYAAPEQHFKDQGVIDELSAHWELLQPFTTRRTDARSDLYSLAATLYSLLTNTLPPSAVERARHLWHHQPDPLRPIHEINPRIAHGLSHLIARAMSFEPEARFASAAEMRAALLAVADDSASAQYAPPELPPDTSPPGTTLAAEPNVPESQPTQPALVYPPARYGLLGSFDSAVRAVAFSPQGTHLAAGGNDGTVRLWNVSTGEMAMLGQCDAGENGLAYVSSIDFAPDGSVASVSSDRAIRVWRALSSSGDEARVLSVCKHMPRSIACSPCGKYLATGSSDGAVHLWDIASGEPVLLGNCAGAVWSVVFTPDGASLAAESDDATIRIWHLESRRHTTLQTFDSDTRSISISKNGQLIAAGGSDKRLRIAALDAQEMRTLALCEGGIRAVAFAPDASCIAVGGEDKSVRLCDTRTGALRTLGQCDDVVSSIAFSPDNRTIASGSWDKSVRLWDAAG